MAAEETEETAEAAADPEAAPRVPRGMAWIAPVICTVLGVLVGAAFVRYTAPPADSGAAEAPAAAAPPPMESAEPPASLTAGMTFGPATRKRADWYFDHRRWPQAIAAYQQAIAAGIDNPDVRTDLGSALRFAGQPDAALAQYQAAQRQDPKHENSLYNEAALYAFTLNDVPKATALWKTYLERFPNGQGAPDVRRFLQAAAAGLPIPHGATASG